MLVIVLGMVTEVIIHPSKALLPIDVMPSGRLMVTSDVQFLNAELLILLIDAGKLTEVNLLQP